MSKANEYILPIGLLGLTYFFGTEILQALGIMKGDEVRPGPAFDPNFWTLKRPAVLPGASVVGDAEDIYNSVHALWANEPAVFVGVIQKMTTKASVSYLCYTFQNLYGVGLLSYLSQYLNTDQMNQGIRIANALPDYMP